LSSEIAFDFFVEQTPALRATKLSTNNFTCGILLYRFIPRAEACGCKNLAPNEAIFFKAISLD
jgi:hypothetical protein